MFVFQTSGRAANLLKEVFQNTNDEAFNCLNTNYYGCKRVTEALLPLLKLSTSGARIVNASSLASELKVHQLYLFFFPSTLKLLHFCTSREDFYVTHPDSS
jgi:NADP-dependent 3-hydroxy acid dehydrogenase YdfG